MKTCGKFIASFLLTLTATLGACALALTYGDHQYRLILCETDRRGRMNKYDWLLLTLNAAGKDGLSPVQLQKSLFIFSKNMPEEIHETFYHFVPYNYGPFDQTIYSDAEKLDREGLGRIHFFSNRKWPMYYVTPTGHEKAKRLIEGLAPETIEYLEKVVAWVRSLSFQSLVRTVYKHFPEFKVNSVFQDH